MGGRNGFTLADYAALSDRQILALLTISWDEDGQLQCETADARGESGSIKAAGRELPKPEDVGLDDRTLAWAQSVNPNVGTFYTVLFWSVWTKRGKTPDEVADLWVKHLASHN